MCQDVFSTCSDDKVNKSAIKSIKITDKDKAYLSNKNDINGTSKGKKIRREKDNPEKKKIFTLGDNMTIHTKRWELSLKIDHKHSIYVRGSSFAKVRSIKDYVNPCVRGENLDHIIMHVGTNDFNSKNNRQRVAKSIVDLAKV